MILGYAAILTTLLLWSGFFISLKGGAQFLPCSQPISR
ncbi:permease [Vibrio sp. JCM 18904]|nr:permease [Vibrio sp. JCM 18904]